MLDYDKIIERQVPIPWILNGHVNLSREHRLLGVGDVCVMGNGKVLANCAYQLFALTFCCLQRSPTSRLRNQFEGKTAALVWLVELGKRNAMRKNSLPRGPL